MRNFAIDIKLYGRDKEKSAIDIKITAMNLPGILRLS